MRKRIWRATALLLAAVMLLTSFSVNAAAAEPEDGTEAVDSAVSAEELAPEEEAAPAPLQDVVMESAEARSDGIIVRWSEVEGAQYYELYRMASGETEWTKLCNYSKTAYKDTSAEVDVTYSYIARARNGESVSSLDIPAVSAMIRSSLDDVTMESATAYSDGIIVRWSEVEGAQYYEVFQRASNETSWTKLCNYSKTAYKDTSAKEDVKYYYKVRARSSSLMSSLDITAVSATIHQPEDVTMVSAKAYEDGIIVRWNSVSGATMYQLFRRAADENEWTRICNTGKTAYKDTTAEEGVRYYYKTLARNGGMTSTLNIDAVGAALIVPTNVKMGETIVYENSIIIRWEPVEGAELYHVYRRAESEDQWTLIRNTGGTAYKDESAEIGVKYYYKVTARNGGMVSSMGIPAASAIIVPSRAMDLKANGYGSTTGYLILVDKTIHKVGVYTGSKGNWTNVLYVDCGDGAPATPTIEGTFYVGGKMYYFDSGSARCFYATQIQGNYLFHSVLYRQTPTPQEVIDPTVGKGVSHGCVRLLLEDAKWIYDNVPTNTTIVIYQG